MKLQISKIVFALLVGFAGIFMFSSFSTTNLPTEPVKTENDQFDDENEDAELYWFYINVKRNKKARQYTIKRSGGSRIVSGTKADYERALWENMVGGRLAIGPFLDFEEAKGSNALYNLSNQDAALEHIHSSEVHWFFLKVKGSERTNSYKLARTAARVASGSVNEFIDAMREGLTFQQLSIGPFWDYQQAEEAKRLYRLEE